MDGVNILLFTLIGVLLMAVIGNYGYQGYRRVRNRPDAEDPARAGGVNLLFPLDPYTPPEILEMQRTT
jgi:hypothetical protein